MVETVNGVGQDEIDKELIDRAYERKHLLFESFTLPAQFCYVKNFYHKIHP